MQNTNARIFAYPNISFGALSKLGHLTGHIRDDDSRREGHAVNVAESPQLGINKVSYHTCLLIISHFKNLVIL